MRLVTFLALLTVPCYAFPQEYPDRVNRGEDNRERPLAELVLRKGDVLMMLDDSQLQEQLKDKMKAHQVTRVAVTSAEALLERVKLQTALAELDGEIAMRAAELKLKRFTGNDPDEKEILKLEAKKARISLEIARIDGKSRVNRAQADFEARKATVELESAQLAEIKEQINSCTIKSPQDGVVRYCIPERANGKGGM